MLKLDPLLPVGVGASVQRLSSRPLLNRRTTDLVCGFWEMLLRINSLLFPQALLPPVSVCCWAHHGPIPDGKLMREGEKRIGEKKNTTTECYCQAYLIPAGSCYCLAIPLQTPEALELFQCCCNFPEPR